MKQGTFTFIRTLFCEKSISAATKNYSYPNSLPRVPTNSKGVLGAYSTPGPDEQQVGARGLFYPGPPETVSGCWGPILHWLSKKNKRWCSGAYCTQGPYEQQGGCWGPILWYPRVLCGQEHTMPHPFMTTCNLGSFIAQSHRHRLDTSMSFIAQLPSTDELRVHCYQGRNEGNCELRWCIVAHSNTVYGRCYECRSM